MSTKDKKDINEEMFDHMIKYGTSEWADDISPDDIPEEDLSDQLNQKMDTMFASVRKKANRKRRFVTARRVAAVFLVFLTMASITVMSVEAFREPIINFIINNGSQSRTRIQTSTSEESNDFSFTYLPTGYKFVKKSVSRHNTHYIFEYYNEQNDETLIIEIDSNTDANTYANIDKDGYTKFVYHNIDYYFVNSSFNQLLWFRNKSIFKIHSTLSKDELLKIAIGLKY